jgi:hypothetical protein
LGNGVNYFHFRGKGSIRENLGGRVCGVGTRLKCADGSSPYSAKVDCPGLSVVREDEKKMQAQIARLAVLHEDFIIEYFGARAEAIPEIDKTDTLTRRFYFVRRTLATLAEMGSAI